MHRIANEIRKEKGYDIAGYMGIRVPKGKQSPCNMFGILRENEPLEKSILGIKYTQPQRADLLGELWKEDERILLKVFGERNYREASGLIKKHLRDYKIKPEKIVFMDEEKERYLHEVA